MTKKFKTTRRGFVAGAAAEHERQVDRPREPQPRKVLVAVLAAAA